LHRCLGCRHGDGRGARRADLLRSARPVFISFSFAQTCRESQPRATMRRPSSARLPKLVGRVEAHLEQNPETAAAGSVLGAGLYAAPAAMTTRCGRGRNVLRLLGSSADREADLGEALAGAANGVIHRRGQGGVRFAPSR